jgi:ABC-type sulfate transport system permease component
MVGLTALMDRCQTGTVFRRWLRRGYAGCLSIFVLGWVNYFFWPVLRFTNPTANAVVLALAFLMPVAASVLGFFLFRATKSPGRFAVAVALTLANALPLVVVGFHLLSLTAANGIDSGFELINAVPIDGGRIAVYRTDGGALTSFGIVVRQERLVVPGVLVVRKLCGGYPAKEAQVTVEPSGWASIHVPDYRDGGPTQDCRVKVRRYVYF